jgi:hypothetical protein
MCDIVIPGLPTTLMGHIVPELSIPSLFGIRILTEAVCTIKFDSKKCVVKYNGKTILVGMKDPMMDLWTLPIVGPAGKTTHLNDEAEQDPFVTLREEFLETTSKASFSNTSMLAVPVCTSAQACTSRGKVTKSLKKNLHCTKWASSPTPSKPKPTASSLPIINPCVAHTSPHSSKLSDVVFSKCALT